MQVEDIRFDDELFSEHNLIVCYLQNSRSDEIEIGNKISVNQVKAVNANKWYNVYSSYEDVLQFEFEVARLACGLTNDEMALTADEINDILYWLNRKEYHKLEFIFDDDSFEDCYFNGTFISVNPEMVSDKVVGFHLVFTTDAPYSHLPDVTEYHLFDGTDEAKDFIFEDVSNEEGWNYGKVQIHCLEDGDLRINNVLDNKPMVIKKCKYDEIITLDGVLKTIETSDNTHKTLANDFNYQFPRVMNKRNNRTNRFTSSLKCEMSITYSPIRKVGGFLC